MADLDELCDLLEEEEEEENTQLKENPEDKAKLEGEEENAQPTENSDDEAKLEAMMAKVEALRNKLASKKKKADRSLISEIDLFEAGSTNSPEKSKAPSPFIEKPNKPIKLHQKTLRYGPSLSEKKSRIITGKEKEELLSKISLKGKDSSIAKRDLALSSDEEEEMSNPSLSSLSSCGKEIKKTLNNKSSDIFQNSSTVQTKKIGFNKIQGSSVNLTNTANNKKLPENLLIEKSTKIRIKNPIISQAQLDLNLINRTLIPIYRLKDSISRKNTEGNDWATIGILFYKNSQTSKNGNAYTTWKMTDLCGSEPIIVSVMLFGRAHAVHYKMPQNKVVGILNPKVLENRGNGAVTISVDHPDKIMEMGDGLDAGKCRAVKSDGSSCTNLVNLATCEYCAYHVKKAYKSVSAKRADIQSSYSGTGDARSRIMSKIAPKGEVFGGGKILNDVSSPKRVAKSSAKLKVSDAQALMSLGVKPSMLEAKSSQRIGALTKEKLLRETDSSTYMSEKERSTIKKALNQGITEEFAAKLLAPTPGSRTLLKHLTRNEEEEKMKEDIKTGSVKTAKDLILEHKSKLSKEINVNKIIEERKKIAQNNLKSVPHLGKGLDPKNGFVNFDTDFSPNSSSSSKVKAILSLKGKALSKTDPNNVKRKRLSHEYLENSRKKVARALDHHDNQVTSSPTDMANRQVLKGVNGQILSSDKLEALKKLKSKNCSLAEEVETQEREKYFDVLEKKDAMEEKMVNTKEIEVKAVSCDQCGYTAHSLSDLCKESGHTAKFIKTKKRFFECTKCSARTTSLDKYPKKTCDNCGNSGWKRAGMMKEKKAVLEHEKLIVRGVEQKFISSNVNSCKLDLDSSF